MSIEGGSRFSGEDGFGGDMPVPGDIQMDDCTLAIIGVTKLTDDPYAKSLLADRVISQEPGQGTTYDCKACFAKLVDAGFSNIQDELSCRSNWREQARQEIRGN